MAWTINFTEKADKTMRKLDKSVVDRVSNKLIEIAQLENPRAMGKALSNNKAGLWRYRVGNYRIICHIEDEILLILVVDVAHRSKVYRH